MSELLFQLLWRFQKKASENPLWTQDLKPFILGQLTEGDIRTDKHRHRITVRREKGKLEAIKGF